MGVLVLGGNGLVGRTLCAQLVGARADVISAGRSVEDGRRLRGVLFRRVDMATFTDWAHLLTDVDTVYHLAWSTIPSSAAIDPAQDIVENVVGTVRMLEAARRIPHIRIVFASSGGAVYGTPDYLPIDERHPVRPISAYGVSKLMVEHYIQKYRQLYGIDGVCLRISNCYGGGQSEKKGLGAIALFARAALKGEPIKLFGDGQNVRDYVHVDDVVAALIATGNARRVPGPLNIGSGVGHSLLEVVTKIEAAVGRRLEVERVAARGFDVPASILYTHRAYKRIGWKATIDIDHGIAMVLDELRAELGLECELPSMSTATIRSISTARKAIRGL